MHLLTLDVPCVQAASQAVAAALSVNQGSSVTAADVAAFSASNATAIAAAKTAANDTARPGINCLDYSYAYADAITTVLQNNQTSAAATGIAAAFAQGCAVSTATGLAITEAIYNMGCSNGIGAALISKISLHSAKACRCVVLSARSVYSFCCHASCLITHKSKPHLTVTLLQSSTCMHAGAV